MALWFTGNLAPNKKRPCAALQCGAGPPLLHWYKFTNHGAGNQYGHPLG